MKNSRIILICGESGTGKTTLSKKIKKEKNFKYISDFEIIKNYNDNISNLDKKQNLKIPEIIYEFIKNINDENIVVDLKFSSLYPENFINLNLNKFCEIYYLGFDNVSYDELLNVFKIKNPSEQNLETKVKNILNESQIIKKKCNEFDLPFISINKNRNKILEALFNNIINKNL